MAALAIVFALPLLESSVFAGFVVPGEIAVLLGGVLAAQHRVALWQVLVAAIAGAVLGDTIGYAVGRRWGHRLLHGTVGRLVQRRHLDRAERHLAERGAKAVFFGRFTAALRVLVPGLAGMAGMRYRTFVVYNVAGGAVWATETAVIGYVAGASWRHAEHLASRIGLAVFGLFAAAFGTSLVVRALRRRGKHPVRATRGRLAASAPVAWARRRLPRQSAWSARRFDPAEPDGLGLTAALAVAVLAAWTFGGLTEDVIAGEALARADPRVHADVMAYRSGWFTAVMSAVTWLGSSVVLIPLLVVATVLLVRAHRRNDTVCLWLAFAGAVALYDTAKAVIGRARPPAGDRLVHVISSAYPSGHTTQSIATWGMLAVVLAVGRSRRTRLMIIVAAAVLVLFIGVSRVYLGAHWLTDVLGGYALGGAWLALVLALRLRHRATVRRREP